MAAGLDGDLVGVVAAAVVIGVLLIIIIGFMAYCCFRRMETERTPVILRKDSSTMLTVTPRWSANTHPTIPVFNVATEPYLYNTHPYYYLGDYRPKYIGAEPLQYVHPYRLELEDRRRVEQREEEEHVQPTTLQVEHTSQPNGHVVHDFSSSSANYRERSDRRRERVEKKDKEERRSRRDKDDRMERKNTTEEKMERKSTIDRKMERNDTPEKRLNSYDCQEASPERRDGLETRLERNDTKDKPSKSETEDNVELAEQTQKQTDEPDDTESQTNGKTFQTRNGEMTTERPEAMESFVIEDSPTIRSEVDEGSQRSGTGSVTN
ncbi:hypothetical protein BaRGS_00006448 [Batillaria attramentaria]|uniref:Uncharacterized protein n=1 Tax=Batillaria attramentaria TaxID=370345 RepID=A0ABD0LSH5_9CAEN